MVAVARLKEAANSRLLSTETSHLAGQIFAASSLGLRHEGCQRF